MRLFSYCIPIDDGAAPNPFFEVCTLNICKPVIRRTANVGDWVVGVGSKNVKGKDYSGQMVYAMKVTQKMTMEAYNRYCTNNLPEKIPDINHVDYSRRVGDSIYSFQNNKSTLLPSVHNMDNVGTDIGGKFALLSNHFYYFGNNAIKIPTNFKGIIKQGQGHKSNANDSIKEEFVFWLESQNFTLNHLYGEPQIKIEFHKNDGIYCANVRCESAKEDEELEYEK